MRRTLALLALLATAWPHVAALECAVAPGHEGHLPGVENVEDGHEAGAAHAHHVAHGGARVTDGGTRLAEGPAAGTFTEPSHTAGHGTDSSGACTLVMACGVAMIQVDGPSASTLHASPVTRARVATLEAPAAIVLAADPPPPRRNA